MESGYLVGSGWFWFATVRSGVLWWALLGGSDWFWLVLAGSGGIRWVLAGCLWLVLVSCGGSGVALVSS
jgi:hypothetical protein